MAEISFNDVFDAVTLALHNAFPDAHIWGEDMDQGVSPGDFNVLPITANHTFRLGSRAERTSTFDVIYSPSTSGGRVECLTRAQIMPYVLEHVTTAAGDHLHCSSFSHNITDDVLHCIVSYNHFVLSTTEKDEMRALVIKEVSE